MASRNEEKSAEKAVEATQAAVQEQADKEQEQGFRGVKTDPIPDHEYSLLSGPESPRAVEDIHTRTSQVSIGKVGG
jgi:hypothetical protein